MGKFVYKLNIFYNVIFCILVRVELWIYGSLLVD